MRMVLVVLHLYLLHGNANTDVITVRLTQGNQYYGVLEVNDDGPVCHKTDTDKEGTRLAWLVCRYLNMSDFAVYTFYYGDSTRSFTCNNESRHIGDCDFQTESTCSQVVGITCHEFILAHIATNYSTVFIYDGKVNRSVCYHDHETSVNQLIASVACLSLGLGRSTPGYLWNPSTATEKMSFALSPDMFGMSSLQNYMGSSGSCQKVLGVQCAEATCAGQCGKNDWNPHNCQCNYACAKYQDCCPGFLQHCTSLKLKTPNATEGVLVVVESSSQRDVGYICRNEMWNVFVASAVCRDLSFNSGLARHAFIPAANVGDTYISSYAVCESEDTRLSECQFSSEVTEAVNCTTVASVACQVSPTSTSRSQTSKNMSQVIPIQDHGIPAYIYGVIAVIAILLLIAPVIAVLVCKAKRRDALKRDSPAEIRQSLDLSALPTHLVQEPLQQVQQNAYVTHPTALAPERTRTSDDADYSYVGAGSVSALTITGVSAYEEIPLTQDQSAQRISNDASESGDDGMVANILYGQT